MSNPQTEAMEISNDSLFSDSFVLDSMEALPKLTDPSLNPLAPGKSYHMKPRQTPTMRTCRFEPLALAPPADDPADAFDLTSVCRLIYESDDSDLAEMRNGEPDMPGELSNCFDVPGLLYRVVDRAQQIWAFYNDSTLCEIDICVSFGNLSRVIPLDATTLQMGDSGEVEARVVVYPGETERFIKGYVRGFKSTFLARPLSTEFLTARREAQWAGVIHPEIAALRGLFFRKGKNDQAKEDEAEETERQLGVCLVEGQAFVDLAFPPTPVSFRGDPKKAYPWARPTMFLRPEQAAQRRLFRAEPGPARMRLGDLGNCWMLCAMATLAESPAALRQIFRGGTKVERAHGAYRVRFNKNGLWREVVVDDYLPVIASAPQVAHSVDPYELWPCIFEKAFAKLHGGYARIESGDPVHVLTDLTGAPSLRIDDELADAAEEGKKEKINKLGKLGVALLHRLEEFRTAGYEILLHTAGTAPPLVSGTDNIPDLGETPEMENQLSGTGLLPGHAYTLLRVVRPSSLEPYLLKIRNPWLWGSDSRCKWSRTSSLWRNSNKKQKGLSEVAQAVGFDPDDSSVLWLTGQEMLEYFSGGGVVFTQENAAEIRIPFTFSNAKPSVILQIQVAKPIKMWMMLSNIDKRILYQENSKLDMEFETCSNYPPIMLSLASYDENGHNMNNDGAELSYRIRFNSTNDPVLPSTNTWTFLQAREIAMLCELSPSPYPYLLIPRMIDGELTVNFVENAGDFRKFVGMEYFENSCAMLCPEEVDKGVKEIPMTLGLRVEGSFDDCQISVRNLPAQNPVFANFPMFTTGNLAKPAGKGVIFQTMKTSQGIHVKHRSNDIL
ncbi:unnamed protein product [Phytomonas sp. Hart1]|nr:unnamed protein product [Phytomonas sp. Hart1]|eukprot:CCW67573.1 unnamed protein product [Phytomonas sp. isolate Hart1]